jgi:hypothetical protein
MLWRRWRWWRRRGRRRRWWRWVGRVEQHHAAPDHVEHVEHDQHEHGDDIDPATATTVLDDNAASPYAAHSAHYATAIHPAYQRQLLLAVLSHLGVLVEVLDVPLPDQHGMPSGSSRNYRDVDADRGVRCAGMVPGERVPGRWAVTCAQVPSIPIALAAPPSCCASPSPCTDCSGDTWGLLSTVTLSGFVYCGQGGRG